MDPFDLPQLPARDRETDRQTKSNRGIAKNRHIERLLSTLAARDGRGGGKAAIGHRRSAGHS
jgi:hypothetical protein